MRTNTVAISVLASCTFIATLLLYPVLKESQVYQVNRLTGLRLVDEEIIAASQNNNLNFPTPQPHQIVLKCVFDTNSPFFMLYTFTVGYIIPAMLITFFYAQVIIKLRNDALAIRKHSEGHMHAPSPSVSSARLHKVTKRIVAVSWSTLTLSSVFFAAHFLVCFNSAANPVLYALINRELRQQHAQAFQKRRRSLHLITTNNTTAMTDKDLNSPTIARLKEHRLSSLGCTDHSRLMLLGNGLLNGQHLENGQQLEKRSSSFSHSTPPMFAGLTSRFSQLRLLSHFGSSQLLNINGEDKLEDLPNFKIEEKKILKNENDVAKQKKSVPSSGGDSDAFL
uniref:G_PROTEIN_RECEP_F1_2 domain-containing protein n=1 Tax=Meloidogyne hapla TaxID=6305 RepID=A0A1I8BPN0_MELHA